MARKNGAGTKKTKDDRSVRLKGHLIYNFRNDRKVSHGISKAEWAAKLGVAENTITSAERSEPVQIDTAMAFASDLGMQLIDLVVDEDRPKVRADFEVDLYRVEIAVEPVESAEMAVQHGYGIPRPTETVIQTDNIGHIRKRVQFNKLTRTIDPPFELSYRTRNGGIIFINNNGEVSDPKVNRFLAREFVREQSRYNDHGDEVVFRFRPKERVFFELDLDIFKGFDRGNRDLTCYLPSYTRYRKIEVSLSLLKYLKRDLKLSVGPNLYFFEMDTDGFRQPETGVARSTPIRAIRSSPDWEWAISNYYGAAALYLYWEFA